MASKFYQTKYKAKGHNIFEILGEIHINSKFTLNHLKTDFVQSKAYKKLKVDLVSSIDIALFKYKRIA